MEEDDIYILKYSQILIRSGNWWDCEQPFLKCVLKNGIDPDYYCKVGCNLQMQIQIFLTKNVQFQRSDKNWKFQSLSAILMWTKLDKMDKMDKNIDKLNEWQDKKQNRSIEARDDDEALKPSEFRDKLDYKRI